MTISATTRLVLEDLARLIEDDAPSLPKPRPIDITKVREDAAHEARRAALILINAYRTAHVLVTPKTLDALYDDIAAGRTEPSARAVTIPDLSSRCEIIDRCYQFAATQASVLNGSRWTAVGLSTTGPWFVEEREALRLMREAEERGRNAPKPLQALPDTGGHHPRCAVRTIGVYRHCDCEALAAVRDEALEEAAGAAEVAYDPVTAFRLRLITVLGTDDENALSQRRLCAAKIRDLKTPPPADVAEQQREISSDADRYAAWVKGDHARLPRKGGG